MTIAAGGLGVQAQQQAVQPGIVAGGCGDLVDLGEAGVRYRPAGAGQPSRLGDLAGRVSTSPIFPSATAWL
jgi:hypothetical protein